MPRIDANIATQIADTVRPDQSNREAHQQAAEAKRQEGKRAEPVPGKEVTAEELRATADSLQKVIESASGRRLDFTINEKLKELIVLVKDRDTGETVLELPPKSLMKMREQLNDLIGMFFNEKA